MNKLSLALVALALSSSAFAQTGTTEVSTETGLFGLSSAATTAITLAVPVVLLTAITVVAEDNNGPTSTTP